MTDFQCEQDKLYFVPLGGCGLFGANLSLYGYNGKWIMVDCGMGFPDDTMPSVDLLVPDITFLKELGDDLIGCVLTHAHEDHIGALEYLWPQFKCPLYATQFTAKLIGSKFSEYPWADEVEMHVVPIGGEITALDPFHIQMINVAHSIPEAQSLAITAGDLPPILHTGDWKIDPQPRVGELTDEEAFRKLGENVKGVLAVMGDSTNAMVDGHSKSESVVYDAMDKVFADYKDGRIFVTCFASNICRMHTVAQIAEKYGRHVALAGRSLWRSYHIGQECGYFEDIPPFIEASDAMSLAPQNSVIVLTGSQGEARAAVAKVSRGDHPCIKPTKDDVLLFSALRIPGNETTIDRALGRFWDMGLEVITKQSHPEYQIHVSGHPYREELKLLYGWTKPKIAIPVHGEAMQMDHHNALAKQCGVEHVTSGQTGSVYHLCPDKGMTIVDEVTYGLNAVEGRRIIPVDHESLHVRRRITFNGAVVVSLIMDGKGGLTKHPKVTALGLIDEESAEGRETLLEVADIVREAVENMPKELRLCQCDGTEKQVAEKARIAARKFFLRYCGKRPQTRVHLFTA